VRGADVVASLRSSSVVLVAVLAFSIAISMSTSAAAQGVPPQQPPPGEPLLPGGPPPQGGGVEIRPGQVQQLFDAMLVMQAQEALSLSEPQYARFLTRLRVLQDTRRRNQQERARLLNELQRLTNARRDGATISEGDLKQRLTALQEVEARSAADMRKAYDGIDEVLDVYQQARFRVFEEQIERRKLELIMRARQQNRDRPVPPRRPPQ
jgi:hypothetical protein